MEAKQVEATTSKFKGTNSLNINGMIHNKVLDKLAIIGYFRYLKTLFESNHIVLYILCRANIL